ncbi:MAG TPA: HNH endonuclease signature motif containing protein [Candidatus Binatia bacterium]|jgi:hypothetical protein
MIARRIDPATERALLSERARFTRAIDVEVQVACRSEAAARLELGMVARELLRRRAYRRLGFVRLADYARERLGLSARSLQSAAWVARRLDALPLVAAAFDRSDLSWAQVRALCALASTDDQDAWLVRARGSTVEALERAAAAQSDGDDGDPEADDGTIDGEPIVRVCIACPSHVRALWRRALELASRVAGEPLPAWRAVEWVAAEAFSGRPEGIPFVDRMILAGLRLAQRMRRPSVDDASPNAVTNPGGIASPAAPTAPSEHVVRPMTPLATGSSDAFALDTRAVAAVHSIRTYEPRIGRLLRIVVDQRVYRAHGYCSLAGYARERLGISARKAWALLKVERATRRGDAFARAYEGGAISWVQALTLLPVVDRGNASAWVARAEAVTVRRLADEVSWILERNDLSTGGSALDPPPLDCRLESPVAAALRSRATSTQTVPDFVTSDGVQIGAHREAAHTDADGTGAAASVGAAVTNSGDARRAWLEVSDAEIRLSAPASVVAVFREALDVFSQPGLPRWSALERVLRHVITHWESQPRHRDPIFERDGWRCAVPGCSSRRNLHDHHLQFRSRGGGNAHDNRVAVCVAHHLHGIHEGVVRAWGSAPRDVHWELGIRAYGRPLLAFVGDRRVDVPRTATRSLG